MQIYERTEKQSMHQSVKGGMKNGNQIKGLFASCGNCPHVAHGFMCYKSEGDCMSTEIRRINQRRN